MARYLGPRFKVCRRLGVNTCGHPKAMARATSPAFAKRKKPTDYSRQLTEKQKLKSYYGILEKQLRKYFDGAQRQSALATGDALVISLERRLDNLVYRMGFANSIRFARQLVSHGHIEVNGRKVDIPSYQVAAGDTITFREKSKKNEHFKDCFLNHPAFSLSYIERDTDNLSAKLARLPERSEVPILVNDQLVVEYYSK